MNISYKNENKMDSEGYLSYPHWTCVQQGGCAILELGGGGSLHKGKVPSE